MYANLQGNSTHALQPIVETRSLTKQFATHTAVDNLSFAIHPGDIYGFLGENGAGKSTTMRMLLGLIHPTSGSVYIRGELFTESRRHLLRHIGAVIERPDMYGYLSGWDNLRMMATLSGKHIPQSRLHEMLALVGLKGREKDKVKAYSQGMKQRLGIAIALVHSPDLLILDEPTNGLDPQGIVEMRELIIHLSRDHGKTILISSHLLYEMEQMATRMLILHKGKKVVEGNMQELLRPDDTLTELRMPVNEHLRQLLEDSMWTPFVHALKGDGAVFRLHPGRIPELNSWLAAQGAAISEIRSRHSLEDYFLSLTHDPTAANRAL